MAVSTRHADVEEGIAKLVEALNQHSVKTSLSEMLRLLARLEEAVLKAPKLQRTPPTSAKTLFDEDLSSRPPMDCGCGCGGHCDSCKRHECEACSFNKCTCGMPSKFCECLIAREKKRTSKRKKAPTGECDACGQALSHCQCRDEEEYSP